MNLEELKQEVTEAVPEIEATLKGKLVRRRIPDCGTISHEDLIQEALLAIWEDAFQRGKFEMALAIRVGWQDGIIRFLRRMRKQIDRKTTAVDPADIDRTPISSKKEIEDRILTWISIEKAQLTEKEARALRLKAKGFTLREIARITKCSLPACKNRICRAEQKIKAQLPDRREITEKASLTEKQATALRLKEKGFTIAEIARITKCSLPACKNRIRYARQKIRQLG